MGLFFYWMRAALIAQAMFRSSPGAISDLVGLGRYKNASEVLREGLLLIEQRA
jgi:hypothetical protein